MDSTIMLDYREVGMETTGLVGRWINLAVIPAQGDNDMITDRSISIHAENVQFRFLQLVHGGIECNCWKDIQLWIENNNDGMAQFHL